MTARRPEPLPQRPLSRDERDWLRLCLEHDPVEMVAAYSSRTVAELRQITEQAQNG